MHEYSIARALIGRVEQEARARQARGVRRLRVRIGDVAGVDADLLATAYAVLREGTVCGAAALDIRPVAASWACSSCGRALAPGAVLTCAHCGRPARLAKGDEILLESIEMEVP